MIKILVIDSITSKPEYTSLNFSSKKPTREYIEHTDDVLDIIQENLNVPPETVTFTTVHVAENLSEPYTCGKTHDNLNAVLLWAYTNKGHNKFTAIYLGISIFSEEQDKINQTEILVNLLGIPIICPAENKESEIISDMTYCPSKSNGWVRYVCSIKNSWSGCVAIEGRKGNEKQRKSEYSSKLSAIYLAELVNAIYVKNQ